MSHPGMSAVRPSSRTLSSSCFRVVEPKRSRQRRRALEAEVRDKQRVAGPPPNDLESEIVDSEALLAPLITNFRNSGTGRGPPRDGVPAGGGGVHRRVKRVSAGAAVLPEPVLPTFVKRAIALDDLGDPGSQIVHLWRERRSATASRTSSPRAYAGPTHDGQPVPHPQDARCSRARSSRTSVDLKSRSLKPIPPGVMSNR